MRIGKVKQAVALLQEIEREKPGLYATAANIGTAYELAGNNDSALYWIREGMRRNRDSHRGTEWLHVQILETKKMLATDPDWLRKNRIVDARTGREDLPTHPGDSDNVRSLYEALQYQLTERLQFVPAPDPIVAHLLTELGHLQALLSSLEEAIYSYDLALEYGATDTSLIGRRRAALAAIVERNKGDITLRTRGEEVGKAVLDTLSLGGIAAVLCAWIGVMFWAIRRGRRRNVERSI